MPDQDPHGFDRSEKRQHERYEVALPITFVCELTRVTYRGTIKNIGLGGVLLETIARLTKMERITLSIPSGESGVTKVGAVVVRFHLDAAFGVAFVALSREDQTLVRTLIDRYLMRPELGDSR